MVRKASSAAVVADLDAAQESPRDIGLVERERRSWYECQRVDAVLASGRRRR